MEEIQQPNINIHPDIAHLGNDQIDEMRNDYLNGEIKVKEIMAKYELSGFHPSVFYKRIPPKVDKTMACPVCNVFAIRLFQGKAVPLGDPFCPDCGQSLISEINPEKRARELRVIKKESRVIEYCDTVIEVPLLNAKLTREIFSQLSFEQKVFLGTAIALCVGEDMTILEGEEIIHKKICPTLQYFRYLTDSLVTSGLLPSNDLWRTRIFVDSDLTKELMLPNDQFGANYDEQFELWKTMAYHEVAECYFNKLEGIINRNTIGKKGVLTIKSLINELSVAQIFYLLYKSHKNVCVFIVNKNVTKPHAANTLLYNCLKTKDRFKQNGWDIFAYNRYQNFCSQSEMSSYLFDKILRIGDKGFTHRPCLEIIKETQGLANE